jgi:lysophospholipid acyltransferase (LPLAT)-like uncharacterized protein
MAKIRLRSAGKWLAWLMRGMGLTMEVKVEGAPGVFDPSRGPVIWVFWHSHMFLVPFMYRHWFPDRRGVVLTSPSGDGQVIADICARFGLLAARGSSSKPHTGRAALLLLHEQLREGYDVGITPDGPRGPRHVLQPGAVKLAQLSGCPIVTMAIRFSRSYPLPTWDRFEVPLPFAKSYVRIGPPIQVPRRLTEDEFEIWRARVEMELSQPPSP